MLQDGFSLASKKLAPRMAIVKTITSKIVSYSRFRKIIPDTALGTPLSLTTVSTMEISGKFSSESGIISIFTNKAIPAKI